MLQQRERFAIFTMPVWWLEYTQFYFNVRFLVFCIKKISVPLATLILSFVFLASEIHQLKQQLLDSSFNDIKIFSALLT